MLKNPECKKYIQCSEKFKGTLCFSGQAKNFSKILNGKKYFNAVKNFRTYSVFQIESKLIKNLECKKYIQWSRRATRGGAFGEFALPEIFKTLHSNLIFLQKLSKNKGEILYSNHFKEKS